MKITFLGTSAGESYPAIWCDCPNCTYAREHGGKNIRMNTGSMIDDDILNQNEVQRAPHKQSTFG